MLGAGALGRLRGMVRGGRREEGSTWGTRVCLWWIHVDIWQNQHNIVKLKNKIKNKKKEKHPSYFFHGQNHHGVMIFVMNHRCDVSFSSHQETCDINVMT